MYQLLVNDGRFSPNFVGSNTVLDNATPSGYNELTGANQLHHEGHGGYTTSQILTNLNANGNWLAAGNGVNPDYVTLSVGGNDYGADGTETTGPVDRVDAIVSYLQQLRPASGVILANLFYRTQTTTNASRQAVLVGDLQNTYSWCRCRSLPPGSAVCCSSKWLSCHSAVRSTPSGTWRGANCGRTMSWPASTDLHLAGVAAVNSRPLGAMVLFSLESWSPLARSALAAGRRNPKLR